MSEWVIPRFLYPACFFQYRINLPALLVSLFSAFLPRLNIIMCIVLYSSLRSFLYRNGGFLEPAYQSASQSDYKKIIRKKRYIFVLYPEREYFCTRFPREESLDENDLVIKRRTACLKNKKTSEKFWNINKKVLIFAVRFAKKRCFACSSFYLFFPFRIESLRNG